jgi:lysozyme
MELATRIKLINRLKKSEGFRQFPYVDTTGNLTIGFGRNLRANGISMDEASYLLEDDMRIAEAAVWKYFPDFGSLNEARKSVIVDMAFNMGIQGLLGFKHMISAIKAKDFAAASNSMLNSKWHTQVGKRAEELAMIMQTGNF